jgi:pSer/pThr/pTyr-binding forkhead associated (FHA) protein
VDKSAGGGAEDVVVPPTLERPGARNHSDRAAASVDEGTVVDLGSAPVAPKFETARPHSETTRPGAAPEAAKGSAAGGAPPAELPEKGGVTDGTVFESAAYPPQQLSRGTQTAQPESQAPIDLTETVIETAVVVGIQFNQVEPKEHAAPHFLDQSAYLLGRSRECDLRLYSGTASRQHAKVERRDDGWHVVPLENKQVIADGKVVRGEIRLRHGMRLRLGGDEFEVVDPGVAASSGGDVVAARGRRGARRARDYIFSPLALVGAVLLLAAALGLWWLLFE